MSLPDRNGWTKVAKGPVECSQRSTADRRIVVIERFRGNANVGLFRFAVSIAGGPIDIGTRTAEQAFAAAEGFYFF